MADIFDNPVFKQETVQEPTDGAKEGDASVETPIEELKEESAKEPTKITGESKETVGEVVEVPEYLKKVSEIAGSEFKSDEDIKTLFEKAGKVDGLEKDLASKTSLQKQYDDLSKMISEKADMFDPYSKYEGTLDEKQAQFKRETVWNELRKNGDPSVAAKMLNIDTSKMNNIDVISMWHQFKTPGLSGDEAEAVGYSEAGVDIEAMEDEDFKLNKVQNGKLAVKAQEIRNNINELVSGVEVPEIPNPYKELTESIENGRKESEKLLGKWTDGYGEKLIESLDKIELKDLDFEYEIDNSSKSVLVKEMVDYAVIEKMEPTEDNIKAVIETAKKLYLERNALKIMSALRKDAATKSEDAIEKKVINQEPIDKTEAPSDLHDDKLKDLGSRVLKQMGID